MSNTRRKFSREFKFKKVLKPLKECENRPQNTIRFGFHQSMINNCKFNELIFISKFQD